MCQIIIIVIIQQKWLMLYKNIWLLLLSPISLLCSCSKDRQTSKKLEFPLFQIQVPTGWKVVSLQGIDSYISGILTDQQDTLIVGIDNAANSEGYFGESIVVRSLKIKKELDSVGFKYSESMVFSSTPELDEKEAIHLKQYYLYDTISNKVAKVGLPKRIGQGITFVQFKDVGAQKEVVRIYGRDLDTTIQFSLYRAFQTITFVEPSK